MLRVNNACCAVLCLKFAIGPSRSNTLLTRSTSRMQTMRMRLCQAPDDNSNQQSHACWIHSAVAIVAIAMCARMMKSTDGSVTRDTPAGVHHSVLLRVSATSAAKSLSLFSKPSPTCTRAKEPIRKSIPICLPAVFT